MLLQLLKEHNVLSATGWPPAHTWLLCVGFCESSSLNPIVISSLRILSAHSYRLSRGLSPQGVLHCCSMLQHRLQPGALLWGAKVPSTKLQTNEASFQPVNKLLSSTEAQSPNGPKPSSESRLGPNCLGPKQLAKARTQRYRDQQPHPELRM